jgi:hypothetical protein
MKTESTPGKLGQGKPNIFQDYFEYVRMLEFTETPNYEALKNNFWNAYLNANYKRDGIYFWQEYRLIKL